MLSEFCFTLTIKKLYRTFLLITMVSLVGLFLLNSSIKAQLDPTFDSDGVAVQDFGFLDDPLGTFVLPDNKIFTVVQSRVDNDYFYRFIRFNQDGTLDVSYGNGGVKLLDYVYEVNVGQFDNASRQPDGKIILVGTLENTGLIARFNADGTLDTDFGDQGFLRPNVDGTNDTIPKDFITDVNIYPDGKLLFLGRIRLASTFYLTRYLPDGSLDLSFNGTGVRSYAMSGIMNKLHRQTDGKILVSVENRFPDGSLVKRFNEDGSIDNTFSSVPQLPNVGGERAFFLPDGKILVGGATLENEIILNKFNANGTPDTSFGNNGQTIYKVVSGFDFTFYALAVRPDGQIIVASGTSIGENRSEIEGDKLSLTKLSPTGQLIGRYLAVDGGFSNFTGGIADSLQILPDGKILLVGQGVIIEEFPGGGFSIFTDFLLSRFTDVPFESYQFRAIPYNFLKDVTFPSEPTTFRPSDSGWGIYLSESNVYTPIFGLADDILVPADYTGNLATDLAVFRPSNGTWYYASAIIANPAQDFTAVQWGTNGDVPVPAYFDDDSTVDIAVWRPSDGVWYIRNSSDDSHRFVKWGTNGDKPVPGDYDGDGLDDLAVFRPSTGVWYILQSSDGQPRFVKFGLDGDIPVQEDFDGDGVFDIAVWRPSDGTWYVLRSSDGGFYGVRWGLSEDYAVPADYDGDRKADIAIWRPSEGNWYILQSSDSSVNIFNHGISTDRIPARRQ